jgi:hypothetical protein
MSSRCIGWTIRTCVSQIGGGSIVGKKESTAEPDESAWTDGSTDMLYMKTSSLLTGLLASAFAISLPCNAGAMSGHGGFHGAPAHGFAPHNEFHREHFADRRFDHHPERRRFFFGFDFVGFGFPYWWYPDYYYYPADYAAYDNNPIYDYRYWYGLGVAVQTALTQRGYYSGPIDGQIGPASRAAIRAFQRSQNLPTTGLVDPALLKALRLPPVPRVTVES